MKRATWIFALMLPSMINAGSITNNQFINQHTIPMNENDQKKIKETLFQYRDALNASDVKKVLDLYTSEGVFMPSGAPTAIGKEQVRAAYEAVFNAIQLSIEFSIDEIEIIGDYAFARSTSEGTTLIRANNETIPEQNRELFVLKLVNDQWKIDRYMFNKMK